VTRAGAIRVPNRCRTRLIPGRFTKTGLADGTGHRPVVSRNDVTTPARQNPWNPQTALSRLW
jgi:hypothetical protein